jgi:hypothetical protein
MSDFAQGTGWWQASDGKWYPPELHPDAQAAAQAAAPVYAVAPAYEPTPLPEQQAEPAAYPPQADASPAQAVQQVSYPQPQPAGPGWWQASDGNWYPPELHPDAQAAAQHAAAQQATAYQAPAQQATQPTYQTPAYQAPAQQVAQPTYQTPAYQAASQQVAQPAYPAATQPVSYPQPQPAGPGWWQASDGNWYPPELHPDAQAAAQASTWNSGPSAASAPSGKRRGLFRKNK